MSCHRFLIAASLLAASAALPFAASAQQVYRIVGPDGRISFSDKPPIEPKSKVAPAATGGSAGGGGGAGLPFELRQVASRYPVTLYTGANCVPCGAGRSLLSSRGIPFSEKTVSSDDDFEALQRLAGDAGLPLLTIGSQQLKGFSDAEWAQYLDAAGYPKTSALPAGYRNAGATPLVATQRPTASQAAAPAAAPAAVSAPAGASPASTGSNPAGIRF